MRICLSQVRKRKAQPKLFQTEWVTKPNLLGAFQADHIGCAKNGFQSIAQLVPCFALFVGVVIEQIYPVNFCADDMVLAKVDHFAADF